MSVKRSRCKPTTPLATLLGLLAISGALYAEDAEAPEMEFLEYLGLWEESDADWVLLSGDTETRIVAEDTRSDPAPKGEESAENEDES